MRRINNILITGGAGFIGSNLIRYIFLETDFMGRIINVDKLTYASNLNNLSDIASKFKLKRYFFKKVDICDFENLRIIFKKYQIDTVIHLAAESHVDRSIVGPTDFIHTNILGTFNLLQIAGSFWTDRKYVLFHHVSTDEVYGSLGKEGYFSEETAYDPRSPYSASKASSDHLVKSYFYTYNLPVTVSNCSNNYGPRQYPEKLIPFMISRMLEKKELPVYGDGKNIRDWLYVDDHSSAIWKIINNGRAGQTYNIGGDNEWENIELVKLLCKVFSEEVDEDLNLYESLITFVKDRPGHDKRYAVNCEKIKNELDWKPSTVFESGLRYTLRWYLKNDDFIKSLKNNQFENWLVKNYNSRSNNKVNLVTR